MKGDIFALLGGILIVWAILVIALSIHLNADAQSTPGGRQTEQMNVAIVSMGVGWIILFTGAGLLRKGWNKMTLEQQEQSR
jgi:hypothetical protein